MDRSALRNISVVIPSYRRCASVRRLLIALSNQTLSPDSYEVIVSIDGSEDGTREMASEFQAPYRLRALWNPNSGRATACNRGARAASEDLLLVLDDDMEPTEHLLAAHLQAHQRAAEEGAPEICVIGAVPIRFDRSSTPLVQWMGAFHAGLVKRLSQPGYRLEMRDFATANLSMRRETFLRIGGFDETFKVYGNEDYELFFRVTGAGLRVLYSVDALAYQHYEKDFLSLARDRISAGKTFVQLASKNPAGFDELFLAKYRQGPRRWRWMRTVLLWVSGIWNGMPQFILRLVNRVLQIWPRTFLLLGPRTLDYLYWLSALGEVRKQSVPFRLPK